MTDSSKMQEMIFVSSASGAAAGGSSLPDQPPRSPREGTDRQKLAEKLRSRGWSYRRIAAELRVSYILVSRWLERDDPPAPAPREPLPAMSPPRKDAAKSSIPAGIAPAPSPRVRTMVEVGSDADSPLAAQLNAVERYMREVVGSLETRHDALLRRQEDLLRSWESERSAAKARESELLELLNAERAHVAETQQRLHAEFERFKADWLARAAATPVAAPAPTVEAADTPSLDEFSLDDDEAAPPAATAPEEEDPFSLDDDEPATVAAAPAPPEESVEEDDPFSLDLDEGEGESQPPAEASSETEDPFALDDDPPAPPPIAEVEAEPEAPPPKKRGGLFFWRR